MFGPRVESSEEDDVPPFYISLRILNMFLHNTKLDLGSSHNLMPKIIMITWDWISPSLINIYFLLIQERLNV